MRVQSIKKKNNGSSAAGNMRQRIRQNHASSRKEAVPAWITLTGEFSWLLMLLASVAGPEITETRLLRCGRYCCCC
jgi:hypothetical protein